MIFFLDEKNIERFKDKYIYFTPLHLPSERGQEPDFYITEAAEKIEIN
jgi:hypothetical protein